MSLTERRLYPRIATDIEAHVLSLDRKESLRARLINVSLGGLRIKADAALRDRLLADPDVFPLQTEISFEVPQGRVRLTCRHIHTLRISMDVFELGFKILQTGDDQEGLKVFIDDRLGRS